jgi:hypothetical protein
MFLKFKLIRFDTLINKVCGYDVIRGEDFRIDRRTGKKDLQLTQFDFTTFRIDERRAFRCRGTEQKVLTKRKVKKKIVTGKTAANMAKYKCENKEIRK